MKNTLKLFGIVLAVILTVSACAPQPATPAAAPTVPQPTTPAATPTVQATKAPADLYQKIMQKGVMVVGTSADYAPFESKDQNGNYVGLDVDVINQIGKQMGVKVQIEDMGFDVLITAVEQGKIDAVIASMSATPERAQQVDFTIPYFFGDQTFLAAKGSTIDFKDPKEAAKYRIGVQSGTIHDTWVTNNLVNAGLMSADKVSRYERADNAALDLNAGRIDLLFIDASPALDLISKMGLKNVLTGDICHTAGAAIAVPKGETELKQALDKQIQALIDQGFMAQEKTQWNAH